MTARLPNCRSGVVVYRNAAHAGAPLWPALIRGEVVGVIGFLVRSMAAIRFLARSEEGGAAGAAVAGAPPRGLRVASRVAGGELPLPEGGAPPQPPPSAAAAAPHVPGSMLALLPPLSYVGQAHLLTTARADPKGTIPGYLVDFIAQRTPRMWVQRLVGFLKKRAAKGAAAR
jgi:hypothetical protein